jgi:hypothetical protein
MRYLFVPALLGLAMAGCTSSETQGLAAPATPTVVPAQAAFDDAGDISPAYDRQPMISQPAQTATASAAGFPPPPACGPRTECAVPARIEKCRTVGSVTTCDVPPDPAADSTRYTN